MCTLRVYTYHLYVTYYILMPTYVVKKGKGSLGLDSSPGPEQRRRLGAHAPSAVYTRVQK